MPSREYGVIIIPHGAVNNVGDRRNNLIVAKDDVWRRIWHFGEPHKGADSSVIARRSNIWADVRILGRFTGIDALLKDAQVERWRHHNGAARATTWSRLFRRAD